MIDKLEILVKRLRRIGIDITLSSNYPFVYLDTINGKEVTEIFYGKCGFTIAFEPLSENQKLKFTDLSKTFELIREYK